MQKINVKTGENSIDFFLQRKRVKNINLRIKSNSCITVSANSNVPLEYILDFVKQKSDWILKNQKKYLNIQNNNIISTKYANGDKICFLGYSSTLNLIQSDIEKVKIKDNKINVFLKDVNDETKKLNILKSFYSKTAKEIFNDSKRKMSKKIGLAFDPELRIKKVISRWGSCSINKKRIMLNSALIYAPETCIDYVVLHELIHFTYPGHDKNFYKALTRFMPDWKERKKILETIDIRNNERLV